VDFYLKKLVVSLLKSLWVDFFTESLKLRHTLAVRQMDTSIPYWGKGEQWLRLDMTLVVKDADLKKNLIIYKNPRFYT
jgi:hypothetical protein